MMRTHILSVLFLKCKNKEVIRAYDQAGFLSVLGLDCNRYIRLVGQNIPTVFTIEKYKCSVTIEKHVIMYKG